MSKIKDKISYFIIKLFSGKNSYIINTKILSRKGNIIIYSDYDMNLINSIIEPNYEKEIKEIKYEGE